MPGTVLQELQKYGASRTHLKVSSFLRKIVKYDFHRQIVKYVSTSVRQNHFGNDECIVGIEVDISDYMQTFSIWNDVVVRAENRTTIFRMKD